MRKRAAFVVVLATVVASSAGAGDMATTPKPAAI
jgi:hypothetical protein